MKVVAPPKYLVLLNNYKYIPKQSNCYVVTDPALREIYAAQWFFVKLVDSKNKL